MSNYIKEFVKTKLSNCQHRVWVLNSKIEKPNDAYPFLVSTTITSIKGSISRVSHKPINCKDNVEYFKLRESLIQDIIFDIINDNIYTNTFNVNNSNKKYSDFRKNYYYIAKDTFKKVDNEIIPLCNLNDDALFQYYFYNTVKTVVDDSFIYNEKDKKITINKDSEFVKDYLDFNKEVNDNTIVEITKRINLANEEKTNENVEPETKDSTIVVADNNSKPEDSSSDLIA